MKALPSKENGARGNSRIKPLAARLLAWYREHRRDLPWRENVNAYRVWVSEVMLQQTRVDVVAPYFQRFLDRFPEIADLANASTDEVVALWSGLGYYRRARSLHAGAQHVLEAHGGSFPRDYTQALKIPGVGPYTAGAILSIAYGIPVPVVDGNVERVLTRLHSLEGNPRSGSVSRQLRSLAEELIPPSDAGDFNQALMELGATVCTPAGGKCEACPVTRFCTARKSGDVARFPELPAARKPVPVALQAAILQKGGRYLVERVAQGSFLKGMWVFPFAEADSADPLLERLRQELNQQFTIASQLGTVRHSITFRKITVHLNVINAAGAFRLCDPDRFRWVRFSELGSKLPVSSLTLKIRTAIEATRDKRRTTGGARR